MIGPLIRMLFGSNRNVIAETAEVFRVNAEAQDQRHTGLQGRALEQFAAEFLTGRRSRFDGFMDALNRVPRPAMALGTLALFVTAMVDPVWFAARMNGIALVPEPLWWLLGAIVSFYFGARHQAKGQDFQRELAGAIAAAPQVIRQIHEIEGLRRTAVGELPEATPGQASGAPDEDEPNAALAEWRRTRG